MAAKKQAKSSGAKRGASTGKHPGGRPSLFDDRLVPLISLLARKGATDKEMALACGVTVQTFNNWKKAKPEFFASLKDAKAEADAEVERSLYERALGYSHPAVKILAYEGVPIEVPYVERYPPDTTAAIFWLKNRKPQEWRDKTEVAVTTSLADELRAARERVNRGR